MTDEQHCRRAEQWVSGIYGTLFGKEEYLTQAIPHEGKVIVSVHSRQCGEIEHEAVYTYDPITCHAVPSTMTPKEHELFCQQHEKMTRWSRWSKWRRFKKSKPIKEKVK